MSEVLNYLTTLPGTITMTQALPSEAEGGKLRTFLGVPIAPYIYMYSKTNRSVVGELGVRSLQKEMTLSYKH